jgi:hypothetical protein
MTCAIVNDRVDALYCPKCQGRDEMALRCNPTALAGLATVGLTRKEIFSGPEAMPRPRALPSR